MGGGSWPRGGNKRKTRPDIVRRRERQRDWESCNRTRKRRILRSGTHCPSRRTRSTIGEGRGCNNFSPVLGGDGTKVAPTGDIFDQPPGRMSSIRGKLADHLEDHVVLSPEGTVLATSTGMESLYPRPPQSLNNSTSRQILVRTRDGPRPPA